MIYVDRDLLKSSGQCCVCVRARARQRGHKNRVADGGRCRVARDVQRYGYEIRVSGHQFDFKYLRDFVAFACISAPRRNTRAARCFSPSARASRDPLKCSISSIELDLSTKAMENYRADHNKRQANKQKKQQPAKCREEWTTENVAQIFAICFLFGDTNRSM